MKRKILRALTAVSAVATSLAGLDMLGTISIIPAEWAGYLLIATTSLLAVKEVSVVIGDYLDDGKRNNSFKP